MMMIIIIIMIILILLLLLLLIIMIIIMMIMKLLMIIMILLLLLLLLLIIIMIITTIMVIYYAICLCVYNVCAVGSLRCAPGSRGGFRGGVRSGPAGRDLARRSGWRHSARPRERQPLFVIAPAAFAFDQNCCGSTNNQAPEDEVTTFPFTPPVQSRNWASVGECRRVLGAGVSFYRTPAA